MRRVKTPPLSAIPPTDTAAAIAAIQQNMVTHLQRVGIVRYNPFADTGGDQSFSLALADAEGNGVVVSSLHRRNENRVYAKPLARWESTYLLTEEEKQAIVIAREGGAGPATQPD